MQADIGVCVCVCVCVCADVKKGLKHVPVPCVHNFVVNAAQIQYLLSLPEDHNSHSFPPSTTLYPSCHGREKSTRPTGSK